MVAKLCGPGGVQAVIAENLLLRQQLIVLRRGRRRAPSLTLTDRILCGFGSLSSASDASERSPSFSVPNTPGVSSGLVRRKYRRLCPSTPRSKKPGPKGPDEALIQATASSSHAIPGSAPPVQCGHLQTGRAPTSQYRFFTFAPFRCRECLNLGKPARIGHCKEHPWAFGEVIIE
jgi:hypothetical protein